MIKVSKYTNKRVLSLKQTDLGIKYQPAPGFEISITELEKLGESGIVNLCATE
jgi:hypothetical protein